MRQPARRAALTISIVLTLGACASGGGDSTGARSESTPVSAASTSGAPPGGRLTFTPVTDELKVPRNAIPVGDGRLLISDQHGTVRVLDDGDLRPQPLLDIRRDVMPPTDSSLELGLAGVALAPDFAKTGNLYTFATEKPRRGNPSGTRQVSVLRRWTVDTKTLVADPDSGTELLAVPSRTKDHVGGDIAFDADGYLFIGLGSGTGDEAAQDSRQLAGKVLRIRPEANGKLTPAKNNPYASGGGDPRVLSMGYRNPWRADFDDEWGMLIAEPMFTESAQHVWSPLAGDNGGYPDLPSRTPACWQDGTVVPQCQTTEAGLAITPPSMEYDSGIGVIASGVVAVRGEAWGELDGKVLVSDWRGKILAATPGKAPWSYEEVATDLDLDGYLWELDGAGEEVYAMVTNENMGKGTVYQVTMQT
ncbi:MAG: PQQ-dependent sugar dehydrogenase [Propionibacteriales bacterium]|nr:PQQ-dependent sugar dehydrogenase [Propionibacteriales bacterium]